MRTTRPPLLLAVFVVAGVISGLLLRETYDQLPSLPVGPIATVLVIAIVEFAVAWTTRNRLGGRNLATPIDPIAVARLAALARASSPVGAVITGAWTGALVFLLRQRGGVAVVDHDRRLAIAGIVTGLLLTGVALWLEWVCRIRRPPEENRDSHQRAA